MLVMAAASDNTLAFLALMLAKSTVCAICAFSSAICTSALKFRLAMSLILAALVTRVWKSCVNSRFRNSARFSAANSAVA